MTIDAGLDAVLSRMFEKSKAQPGYERMFRCAGGCEDTGWVVVDDGVRDGRRVRGAVVCRCAGCGGKPARRATEVSGGSFS